MGPLLVLLWKHFLVRKRRFIHTPVEWLSPIVFLVILFANKDIFFLSHGLDKYNEAKITVSNLFVYTFFITFGRVRILLSSVILSNIKHTK